MVGSTRRNLLSQTSSYNKSNSLQNRDGFDKLQRGDVENGYGSINPMIPRQRFHDAIKHTIHGARAMEMKKKLIENVDHQMLEHFRKSDESV
jgi:hypothetical protein